MRVSHLATALALLSLTACGNEVILQGAGGGGGGTAPSTTPSTGSTPSSTTPTGPSSGLPCGPGNPPCPPTEYCDRVDCEGSGTCTLRPNACTDDCPGVCGCDGESYCNACQAQSEGVDVGPEALCTASDVAYRAVLWLGGMDHLIITRADYGAGTCAQLFADWPSEGGFGAVATPDGWGVNVIFASDDVAHCLDDEPVGGQIVQASAATGLLAWSLEPGAYYPCELDIDVAVSFDAPPSWLVPTIAFEAQGLVVEGGCF